VPEEVPLGGNLQDAVRIGDAVHRRAGPWTPSVHALLRYLEGAGFPAPRVVGMDGQGREVLRFIEGEAHSGTFTPLPDAMFVDQHVVAAAKLLRRYHDAASAFRPPPNAKWRIVAPTPYEVICHNDWTPWNALLKGGEVAVVLDWDLAGPGTRLWDVVNAATSWARLSAARQDLSIKEVARQVRLFIDSYGLKDRSEFLFTLRQRLEFIGEFVARQAEAGDPGMRRLVGMGVPRWHVDDIALLDKNWATLQRAL